MQPAAARFFHGQIEKSATDRRESEGNEAPAAFFLPARRLQPAPSVL
jgi:hypothetical protein